jgi:hypothetical protein
LLADLWLLASQYIDTKHVLNKNIFCLLKQKGGGEDGAEPSGSWLNNKLSVLEATAIRKSLLWVSDFVLKKRKNMDNSMSFDRSPWKDMGNYTLHSFVLRLLELL